MTYHIIVRGKNCAKYLNKALNSVLEQTLSNWKVTILLDPSTDESWDIASRWSEEDCAIKAFMNNKDMGVVHNIYHGALLTEAEDEDVIGYLDADDTIAPNALEEVDKEAYSQGYLVSYGSFKKKSTGKRCKACIPYPKGANVRKHKYLAMHFRTMKYKVFKKIPMDYFMHKDRWLEAASDVALMIPAMEIAGLKNCKFIKKKIYFYRDNYSGTMNRKKQYRCEMRVRKKKPLERVF